MECVGPDATTAIVNESVSDQMCRCRQRTLPVEAVMGHRQCLVRFLQLSEEFGSTSGACFAARYFFFFFFPFLFSQFKCKLAREIKNKAQVELLQLRIPPNAKKKKKTKKKKKSPGTKCRCQRRSDPLLIF